MTPQLKGALVAVLVVSPLTAVMAATIGPEALLPAVAVLVAAKIANLAEGRPKKNSANLQSYEPVSQSRAAELLNVGTRTVAAAKGRKGEQ